MSAGKGYIIIMYTNICTSQDLGKLSITLDSFSSVMGWSIDMFDCDKVLRIEASKDITISLIKELRPSGIECNLKGIFNKRPIHTE